MFQSGWPPEHSSIPRTAADHVHSDPRDQRLWPNFGRCFVEHAVIQVTTTASGLPQPAVDPDEHLVEVPRVAGARAPPAQLVGLGLPELGAPPPHRLVTHRDTAYQHQLLDLTKAQREPEVQPHPVVDDLNRVAVALLRRRCGAHPTNPPRSATLTNVTVPPKDRTDVEYWRRVHEPVTVSRGAGPDLSHYRDLCNSDYTAWLVPSPHRPGASLISSAASTTSRSSGRGSSA
jgi:hypothetical protein